MPSSALLFDQLLTAIPDDNPSLHEIHQSLSTYVLLYKRAESSVEAAVEMRRSGGDADDLEDQSIDRVQEVINRIPSTVRDLPQELLGHLAMRFQQGSSAELPSASQPMLQELDSLLFLAILDRLVFLQAAPYLERTGIGLAYEAKLYQMMYTLHYNRPASSYRSFNQYRMDCAADSCNRYLGDLRESFDEINRDSPERLSDDPKLKALYQCTQKIDEVPKLELPNWNDRCVTALEWGSTLLFLPAAFGKASAGLLVLAAQAGEKAALLIQFARMAVALEKFAMAMKVVQGGIKAVEASKFFVRSTQGLLSAKTLVAASRVHDAADLIPVIVDGTLVFVSSKTPLLKLPNITRHLPETVKNLSIGRKAAFATDVLRRSVAQYGPLAVGLQDGIDLGWVDSGLAEGIANKYGLSDRQKVALVYGPSIVIGGLVAANGLPCLNSISKGKRILMGASAVPVMISGAAGLQYAADEWTGSLGDLVESWDWNEYGHRMAKLSWDTAPYAILEPAMMASGSGGRRIVYAMESREGLIDFVQAARYLENGKITKAVLDTGANGAWDRKDPRFVGPDAVEAIIASRFDQIGNRSSDSNPAPETEELASICQSPDESGKLEMPIFPIMLLKVPQK